MFSPKVNFVLDEHSQRYTGRLRFQKHLLLKRGTVGYTPIIYFSPQPKPTKYP